MASDPIFAITDHVSQIVSDKGSGADMDMKAWAPVANENAFYTLGNSISNRNAIPGYCYVGKGGDGTVFKSPTGYAEIWNDKGSGADSDFAFWLPLAPGGYVAVGGLVTPNHTEPPLSAIMCVKESYAEAAGLQGVAWNDKGSGADEDGSAYRIKDSPQVYFAKGYDMPGGNPAWRIKEEYIVKSYGDEIATAITAKVELIVTDAGSGADMDLRAWRARDLPSGWFTLGDSVSNTSNLPHPVLVCQDSAGLTAKPTGYTLQWADHGSGGDDDISFWMPNAPSGFTAIGGVIQKGYDAPDVNYMRVLKDELTEQAQIDGVAWWDKGSGAHDDGSSWTVDMNPGAFLESGYNQPLSAPRYVHPLPLEIDYVEVTFVGEPTILDTKPETIQTQILQNYTSTDQTQTFSVSQTRQDVSHFKHTSGISVTVGVEFKAGWPTAETKWKVESTASYSYEYGKSSTKSVTYKQDFKVVVPAKKQVTAEAIVTRTNATLNYTGVVHYKDTTHISVTSGTWTDLDYGVIRTTYKETPLK